MLQDFLAYNEQKKLLMPGDTVVAGVSGGQIPCAFWHC